jgi:hypothetical protein
VGVRERDAFWVDHDYDRERAEDGVSRYASHVTANVDRFQDTWGDISPVTFTCVAWELATAPSLDPGFVRWHSRLLEAVCARNSWDGGLTARVRMVSPWPAALAGARDWWHDRGWRGWPEVFGQFVEPTEESLSRVPHMRASLLVEAPVSLGELPPVPEQPRQLAEHARRAVAVVVRELNDLLVPVLRRLDEPRPVSGESGG